LIFAVLGYAITSMQTEERIDRARLILLGEDATPELRPPRPPSMHW